MRVIRMIGLQGTKVPVDGGYSNEKGENRRDALSILLRCALPSEQCLVDSGYVATTTEFKSIFLQRRRLTKFRIEIGIYRCFSCRGFECWLSVVHSVGQTTGAGSPPNFELSQIFVLISNWHSLAKAFSFVCTDPDTRLAPVLRERLIGTGWQMH
jgi:hypothetical protein